MVDDLDKRIIAALQRDLPLVPEPYREIAEELGIDERILLDRLNGYKHSGALRKMGAVLRHRAIGYAANALCAWKVPAEQVDFVGGRLAAHTAVTHCYHRRSDAAWPYNLYAMLHASTRDRCREIAADLAQNTGMTDYIMLFSTQEWKKTSMSYFSK